MNAISEILKEKIVQGPYPFEFVWENHDTASTHWKTRVILNDDQLINVMLWVYETYAELVIKEFVTVPSQEEGSLLLEICNQFNEKSRYASFFIDEGEVQLRDLFYVYDRNNLPKTVEFMLHTWIPRNLSVADQTKTQFANAV